MKDKLAVFKSGDQRAFIESVEKKYSIGRIADICSCSTRTIRDWRREKFNMQHNCAQALSKYADIPLPDIKTRYRYEHVRRAGSLGARAIITKYGHVPVDEEYRKRQWEKWWQSTGKFKPKHKNFIPRAIHTPKRTVELAEFIGTMMGDGGMHKYQAVITLHHIDDGAYIKFVAKRIEELFWIKPRLYHYPKDSVFNIVVSRSELVKYLHELGLPIGNKVRQQFDIPVWIKKNKKFALACIRGLVDTDGSVFTHSYKVKGKWYHYKKLAFSSRSEPLQYSVARILADLGMRPRISRHDVRLDSIADMKKYFSLIGSSNPKHLKRYHDSSTMH